MHENLTTHFASPERAGADRVREQAEKVFESSAARLGESLPYILLMLNRHRQVVYANEAALKAAGAESMEDVLGKRPGEMFDCVHATEMDAGCGTSLFCTQCGWARAILAGHSGKCSSGDCSMLRSTGGGVQGLNLRVSAAPMEVSGEKLLAFTALDVSRSERRKAMERLFFHDVLNLAGGLDGVMEGFAEEIRAVDDRLAEAMASTARSLYEEICAHKDLTQAENGELNICPQPMRTRDIADSVAGIYALHNVGRSRSVTLDTDFDDADMTCDPTLVSRVLGNMVKNALEASGVGETVTIGCDAGKKTVAFWVHNSAYIPEEVQLKIFNPSFSTKGAGRGLGTYSIKLFSETFLGGRATFTSSRKNGTIFRVLLPVKLVREN